LQEGSIEDSKILRYMPASSASLGMAQQAVPLCALNYKSPEAKPRRSNRLRTSKSSFWDQL